MEEPSWFPKPGLAAFARVMGAQPRAEPLTAMSHWVVALR